MIIGLRDSRKKPVLITPFTISHFLFGIIANMVSKKCKLNYEVGFVVWFLIHALYETKDYIKSYLIPCNDYICDNSFFNSIGDQTFAVFGFIVGEKLPIKMLIPLLIIVITFNITGFMYKIG